MELLSSETNIKTNPTALLPSAEAIAQRRATTTRDQERFEWLLVVMILKQAQLKGVCNG
ncbi:MAG: hypothetical protein AAF485_27525 [Chloroflexota bacterium]